MVFAVQTVNAQKKRYVELNSIHALSVPENPDYKFDWELTYGTNGFQQINSKTNVTENITWSVKTNYHATVRPILDSVGCYGEPVSLDISVVEYLSLHTFDDVYFTDINTPVDGNVSLNDFDEKGSVINYNPTPVIQPQHGTVEMSIDGTFTYTPENGFRGIDYFVYEAFNSFDAPMYSNSKVTIVVKEPSPQADLKIVKTGPEKALFGERITYSLVVTNQGPDVAVNVVLRDTLAYGLFGPEFSTGSQPKTWNNEISLGNLNPGDSTTVYLFADISAYSPEYIFNQALTYSDTYDPNNLDNDNIWMTKISTIYVNLPNQIFVPSCDIATMPGDKSAGQSKIIKYEWIPGTGLSDSTIANPVFTPNAQTIGKTNQFVLRVTDNRGFVATDTTYVIVPPVPVAIITGDTLFKDLDENIVIKGDQSIGDGLDYLWYTNDGTILTSLIIDSISISEVGLYYLEISDQLGCESLDSATVLLESHPPIAINDSVAIQAATDSTINVLTNDYDINNFKLSVTGVKTEPTHSTYTFDPFGNFTIRPDSLFWGVDSIEYIVCNNGYPVMCSTAWIIIDALRPPLNADVAVQKTGDVITFWGDTIEYNLSVWSNGPDSATNTIITDKLATGLLNPEYSLNDGATWKPWTGSYAHRDSLRPGEDVVRIKLRAFVGKAADSTIVNTAYISTEIIENDFSNDTTHWITRIKEPVIANAGADIKVGSCSEPVELDATKSSGQKITYSWSPTTYLDDPTSPTPTFTPGATTTYTLTVTDDDGITDQDQIKVEVLPPPMADAGADKFVKEGKTVVIDGSGSKPTGTALNYSWTTINGNIVSGDKGTRATVDTIGVYTLTVTDAQGCTDIDQVEVFPYFTPPFAIPDYYSTKLGTAVNGNVMDNDYEPNGLFSLSVDAGNYKSLHGGNIIMNSDGSFNYTPPGGYSGIDFFNYTLCNSALPPRCSKGYVEITIKQNTELANLTITKDPIQYDALFGQVDGVQFRLVVTNNGPDIARNVLITDTLSQYMTGVRYSLNGGNWLPWSGSLRPGNLNPGDKVNVVIKGTATIVAPDRIYNAASVASETYDDKFEWNNINEQNVDTASVKMESDLLAVAELVERYDNNKNDFTIGACDTLSYLNGENSRSLVGIDYYEWDHRELLNTPDQARTTFNHSLSDTTITFTLTVGVGDFTRQSRVTVHFSKEVIADAGIDRKYNPGIPLVIDATNSQGDGANYVWYNGATPYTNFENGNKLKPIVSAPGMFVLIATDKHGCSSIDTVFVRENELFVVNDFIVLLANDTLMANVRNNDYDPNSDTITYSGVVTTGPSHGILIDNPPPGMGLKSAQISYNKIASDGTFIYVPNKNYIGYDMFQYEACDNNDPKLCVVGTVYIKVIDVDHTNSPPVANPDFMFADIGDTIQSNLLENDYDFDGGKITLTSIVKYPTKGTLVSSSTDGTFRYVANSGSTGIDEFVYQICDNGKPEKCDTARVAINIHKIADENHHPVAVDDAYYSVVKAISGNLLANDYDPEHDEIQVNIEPALGPYNGTIQISPDGSFIYTPKKGFEGTDQFVYQISETRTIDAYSSYATAYITSIGEYRYLTDVALLKTGPAAILSGDTIVYQLNASINGPSLANDVIITDTLFSSLTNRQFSTDGGVSWKPWTSKNTIDQMLLYDQSAIFVRGRIPDIFEGELVNTGTVDHNMNEKDPSNNTSTVVTQVYQKVIANAGKDLTIGACVTEYTFDASASVGMSDLEFNWYPAELLDNPKSSHPVFITSPGESQQFKLVVTSSFNGYFDSDSTLITINVAIKPVARAGEDVYPTGTEPVFLNGSSSTGAGPLEYSWWTYDKDKNVVEWSKYDTLTVNRSGDYYLTVTDIYGCSHTDLMHVVYPVDEFIAVDDIITTYQQQEVDIYPLRNDIIDTINDSYNLDLFTITDYPKHGQLVISIFGTDTVLTYIPEPYYHGPDTFTYIATTQSYTDEAVVYIQVLERRPVVPRGFSPNGDGINDLLIIENIELYEQSNFIVFNRWGNIVYEKDRYSNDEAWDGVANKGIRVGSGPLPTGVYFFILDLGPDERITDRYIQGNIYVASDNRR